jgi:hypothetical protein
MFVTRHEAVDVFSFREIVRQVVLSLPAFIYFLKQPMMAVAIASQ